MRTIHLLFPALLLLTATSLFSQDTINLQMPTSINLDGSPPDGSAMLDVQATGKGLLTPRMTSAQRTTITSPATGLLVFDTDTGSFWFYDGTKWDDLSSPKGMADGDGDTKIQVEELPDEDFIRFDVRGNEAMLIDTVGRVGIGTVPAPSAMLDINATDKGLLLPRLTTTERDAIASPAPGLLIYNTTDSCFNYYSGQDWLKDCGRSLTADSGPAIVQQGGGTSIDESQGTATDAAGNVFVTGNFQGTATFGDTSLTSASGFSDVFTVKYGPNRDLLWAVKGGGVSIDKGNATATDAAGNVFVTGVFQGTATFGDTSLTSAGTNDVFTVKYGPNGNLLWAVKGAGGNFSGGGGTATDAAGNVFVTGSFSGTTTFGDTSLTSASGFSDVFTVKYGPNGNLLWAVKGGGTNSDEGRGTATDAAGNVFVTGRFRGTATFGDTTLNSAGFYDVFTVKYGPNGNLLWAVQGGGTSFDEGQGTATDAAGNVFVTGRFEGTATFGDTTLTSAGSSDVFTVKYGPNGNLLWAVQGGGTSFYEGQGTATDAAGNVFVTGRFQGTATFGDTTLNSAGSSDVFTVKYGPNGNLLWAVQGGGTNSDEGRGTATDAAGNVFVTGRFQGTATFGDTTLTSAGSSDVFLVQYNPSGGQTISVNGLSASQDADADPANELITAAVLNGTNLEITDAGGTTSVNLSGLESDPQVGTNSTNYLPKWDGSALVKSTSVFEDGSGNVGIGTNNPLRKLDVRGDVQVGNNDGSGDAFLAVRSYSSGQPITTSKLELVSSSGNSCGTGGDISVTRDLNGNLGATKMSFNIREDCGGRIERMVIKYNGNVGLGLSSPTAGLHLKQSEETHAGPGGIRLERPGTTDNWKTYIDAARDYNFVYNGTLKAYIQDTDGSYNTTSDRRLKKNIEPLPYVLSRLRQLRPVRYHFSDVEETTPKSFGLIAQEVQPLFPDVVGEKNGYLSMDYGAMGIIAIRAIQEQQAIIDQQQAEIEHLQSQLAEMDELKNRMARLEAALLGTEGAASEE